jgi:hypothetical protein
MAGSELRPHGADGTVAAPYWFITGSSLLLLWFFKERQRMATNEARTPRIARIWRGRTRREVADAYERYNFEVGIRPLIQKAMAVQTFREDRETETEFMTISYWPSVEAMAAFTGGDPTKIHHLDRDAEFLIELPKSVQILHVLTSYGFKS